MQEERGQDEVGTGPGNQHVPAAADGTGAGAEAVVFECAACGVALTGPLARLPEVPEAPYYAWWEADEPGPSPSTVPSGCYAIETEPWGAPLVVAEVHGPVMPRHGGHFTVQNQPLVSQGPRGNIVINPDDARGLELEHAAVACCGASPNGGMNQLCACGTLVATLCSDCCLPYELHLSADHVRAVRAVHPTLPSRT